ncbi:hypothetical protein NDU88_003049 [Pleurodeles waltl]|uniref:exo-alpha-sialidase n=1 Tax=Pleurodeles waltl TaxID=8319 RepID=A0AAV7LHE1_PLEWA|nr:hypothetical protein NDU88_003049 [Pleurodeles waltl]
MNPSPVYDSVTQTIFLLFITVRGEVAEEHQINTQTNSVRLCQITSIDQVKTWSSLTDLTDAVFGSAHGEWATFADGPGHGLQLSDENRTLVIPAYAHRIQGQRARPVPHAFCICSPAHGKSWVKGGFVDTASAVECRVVEIVQIGGHALLYCNARSDQGMSVQALSYTHGVDFADGRLVKKLVKEPRGCHGSVVGFRLHEKASLGNTGTVCCSVTPLIHTKEEH